MRKITYAFFLLPLLAAATEPIWQLGVPDNSSHEFQPYSSREFRTSPLLLNSPDYDAATGTLSCRIPENKVFTAPSIPPALTGGTAGNKTPLRRLRLLWNEDMPGFREFEFRIIYANDRSYKSHRISPNENMDIDGQTWVESGVRVAAPGNRVVFQAVPYDVEQFLARRSSPLIVRIAFPVQKGENILELTETSGNTYGRVFHFDYLKLTRLSADRRPAPYGEFREHENFLNSSVYRVGDPARVGLAFHNLEPGKVFRTEVSFVDYRGNVVEKRQVKLAPDVDGFARTAIPVPKKRSGHFRVRAAAMGAGGLSPETRIAGVREITPLTEEEVALSFIGFSGLDLGLYFPPERDVKFLEACRKRFAEYVRWQKILQIRHERIHSLCWHFIEPEENRYFWEPWDLMIESQIANGIQVQLTLLGTPKWLMDQKFPGRKYRHISEHYFAPPPDREKWREFCSLVARRYGDRVKEFEIWNEVSEQSLFWPGGNAKQYVELVKDAAEAIKKVRPEAKIVAETVWPRQEEFSRRLFNLGIARYVDIHADHYITDARIAADIAIIGQYAPGAPLISNESKMENAGNPLGQVDEPSRRRAAETLFRNILYANSQGFRRLYNFVITGGTWRKWGVVGPDNTPKYTFSVMKTLINRTAGAKFERYHRLSNSLELFLYRFVTPARAEQNGGEYLVILCNQAEKPESLLLPALTERCQVIDLMDNASEVAAPGRIVPVEVGREPVMLTGIDVKSLGELAQLKVSIPRSDLRPGEPTEMDVILPDGVHGGAFSVTRSDGASMRFRLRPGERKRISMPTSRKLLNSVVTLKLTGELELPDRRLPVVRYQEYIIEEQAPGVSLLPPLSAENWRKWGEGRVRFADGGVSMKIDRAATGALTPCRRLNVTPEVQYLLDFRARGSGILRVMAIGVDRRGKTRVLSHNLLSEKLSDQWNNYRCEWRCPADVVKLELHFYEYNTVGEFELSHLNFIRLREGVPVNRQLYKITAAAVTPLLDGKLTGFPAGSFQEIPDRSNLPENPENPLTASYAVAADTRHLYLAVRVHDKVLQGGKNAESLWRGDSVQVDFDLSDGSRSVRTVQFGFGLIDGTPTAFRFRTLPAEDIVPAYRVGKAPAGVQIQIRREGTETLYEAAIPVEAIHPQFSLRPGMRLGFSILVNQNDGTGRLGFLQWSSGIGSTQNSLEFGELILPENLPPAAKKW